MRRYAVIFLILILAVAGCGLLVDSTPPEVEITAPVSTELTEGPVELSMVAADPDSGVKSVAVFVDGARVDGRNFEADDRGAYSLDPVSVTVPWNASEGERVIRVEAINGFGATSADERTVTIVADSSVVAPPSDEGPPEVSWNAPLDGDLVSGTVGLSVYASDDVGVTMVEFWAGSMLLATDTSAPYSFEWDTTDPDVGREDGPVTLRAIAFDAAERRTEESVNVEVMNAGIPPALSIVSPGDGATVGVPFTVTVEVVHSGTDFSWRNVDAHSLWVRIYDEVGQEIISDYITSNGADDGEEPEASSDFLGSRTFRLSDFGDVLATDSVDVLVEGTVVVEGVEIKLVRRSTINLSIESNLPPALLVLAPARVSTSPVFGDTMTIAGRVTDDTGAVDSIVFRMVCETCGPGGGALNYDLFYLDEPYDLFSSGMLPLDGTPYVGSSNDWKLQVVAIDGDDTTLRNVITIDVTVDRSADFSEFTSPAAGWAGVVKGPPTKVDPSSATWTYEMADHSNPVKILMNVEHNGRPVEFVTGTYHPDGNPFTPNDPLVYSRSFGEDDVGTWQIELIMQDTTTGVQYTTYSQSVAVVSLD